VAAALSAQAGRSTDCGAICARARLVARAQDSRWSSLKAHPSRGCVAPLLDLCGGRSESWSTRPPRPPQPHDQKLGREGRGSTRVGACADENAALGALLKPLRDEIAAYRDTGVLVDKAFSTSSTERPAN